MMTIIKRIPLILAFTCAALVASSAGQADENREPVKRYRVIFNCDGHADCKDAKGDLNQWIENLFGPLEDSHVDALFWCDGALRSMCRESSKSSRRRHRFWACLGGRFWLCSCWVCSRDERISADGWQASWWQSPQPSGFSTAPKCISFTTSRSVSPSLAALDMSPACWPTSSAAARWQINN